MASKEIPSSIVSTVSTISTVSTPLVRPIPINAGPTPGSITRADQATLADISTPHYKVVTLGNTYVGKSSLVSCVTGRPVKGATVGASFMTYHVESNGKKIILEIWDTAGQERYRAIAPMYYREAKVVLLVYAIDDMQSFQAISTWIEEMKKNDLRPILFLVGNKSDLVASGSRNVPHDAAELFARDNRMIFYETSAVTHANILELFTDIANKITGSIEPIEPNNAHMLSLDSPTGAGVGYCSC